MLTRKSLTAVAALTLSLALGAAITTLAQTTTQPAAPPARTSLTVARAVAVLYPTKGNEVSGTLYFDKVATGVRVHGDITGLPPSSTHAMHIHEFGDQSSPDGTAAGGHFNPEGHHHAAPTATDRHAGDLGNVKADASGKATVDVTLPNLSFTEGTNPVVGRGVVIHAGEDDFKTQPTGNAGGRIGVAVIGIAKAP